MVQNKEGDVIPVIGLEVHVQLETDTKIFCGCSTKEGVEPNVNVCPVCLGLPGSLPTLNEAAVRGAVKIGKAIGADISKETSFHRKNYFYPDLPKGFQITQYDEPICTEGEIEINVEGNRKRIRIERAHLEEDPGSLQHVSEGRGKEDYVLVDYNRAGIPLVEIVTEPDLRAPKEVRLFLAKLEEDLEFLGVFNSNRDGSLRADANVSLIRIADVNEDGTIDKKILQSAERIEIKNISSYKGAEKALVYEISRQKNTIMHGGEIKQETRHWDENRGITTPMRSKETEGDYRYFTEFDLPILSGEWWDEYIKNIDIPELPEAKRNRFYEEYMLTEEVAAKLTSTKDVSEFYELVVEEFDPDFAARWVADIILGELNYRDIDIGDVESRLDEFRRLIAYVAGGKITEKNARSIVLRRMLDEGSSPEEILDQEELEVSDDKEVRDFVLEVIEENKDAVADYERGESNAMNYLVGQVMVKTKGNANPAFINQILKEIIENGGGEKKELQ
tara:strand:+ start:4962 stop:6476 length:1515 start_codon:yes stop_codon:yes gene_type:complete